MTLHQKSFSNWVNHDGLPCPLPVGTLVDIRHLNGDVTHNMPVGMGVTFNLDGTIIDHSRSRWSGWDYSDGGPMGPKFKAYRIAYDSAREANQALFDSWLNVQEGELV